VDYEFKLLSKIVYSGGAEKLISEGISSRHFYDDKNRTVWDFIEDYISQYSSEPSAETITENFSDVEFEVVSDSFEFIKDQFVFGVKRREAFNALLSLGETLDENQYGDIVNIDELFLQKSRELAELIPVTQADKFSDMKKRIQEYKENKEKGIVKGMRFGIPSFDEATLGLQSHELLTLAAPSGMGKTTTGLYFNLNHYMDGHTPMIISLEMSGEEIYRKLDAMAAHLRQQALKAMNLNSDDVARWEEAAEKAENAANDIIVIDVENATPHKIYAEAARWNPDVIMVDYIQLLEPPKHIKEGYRQVGYQAKELKKIARQLKIPVYSLSQTNTDSFAEGAKLTNISESRAIVHNSDIVLGLAQDEEQFAVQKLEARILKNRGGPLTTFYMLADHKVSEYREWRSDVDEFREPREPEFG
jgi:replicative DNA helicase